MRRCCAAERSAAAICACSSFSKRSAPKVWPRCQRAGISDDLVMLIVDGDGGSVGFDGEIAAHIARRHAVAVAIERQADIFVHERLGAIAIIGKHRRQRPERFGLKTLVGRLTGFAMRALVGDFFQPLARLRVDIRQIGEGAQRPEVLAHISDGAFDFSFFPGRRARDKRAE